MKGYFERAKVKSKVGAEEVPIFEPSFIIDCAVFETISTTTSKRKIEYDKFAQDTLHEVRKLNRDVKSLSEEMNVKLASHDFEQDYMLYRVQNIFAASSLISVRLNAFDFVTNPGLVTTGSRIQFFPYRKFEKSVHCLNNRSQQKQVAVRLEGRSYFSFEAFQLLDLLPYILLENALKYSPQGNAIVVKFDEDKGSVENVGPWVEPNECLKVFERSVRGKHVTTAEGGSGIGLYVVRELCSIHGIKIMATTPDSPAFHLNGVPYASFKIHLDFSQAHAKDS